MHIFFHTLITTTFYVINSMAFDPRDHANHNLITTINNIAQGLDAGSQIDAIFLDLSKVFDKVPHQRLCIKLQHYGIRGPLLTWIQDFLTNRHHRVALEGTYSEVHPVISGVPQRTILAPYVTSMIYQLPFLIILDYMLIMLCCSPLYTQSLTPTIYSKT